MCLLLLSSCCLHGFTQEIINELPKNNQIELNIPNNYQLDAVYLGWDYQLRANTLNEFKLWNYQKMFQKEADEQLSFTVFSNSNIAPGLMMTRSVGADIQYLIGNNLIINAGAYAMKYNYNFGNTFTDAVVHTDANYILLPWLAVGAYGQYSALARYNAQHGSILMAPMVPTSNFGVTTTTMFTPAVGLQGAVGKELDPFTGQWKTVYGIAPVVNFNALFK